MYAVAGRERKAKTIIAVLEQYAQEPLAALCLLNIGGSVGIIDNYLADHFSLVVSIDIDESAIDQARSKFQKSNLTFEFGDAMGLQYADNTFDVVICSQVYEHVPSPEKMMDEIFRVIVPGGVCYFAASNRLRWNEPHYNLPLLSVIPRPLAHFYIRLAGKANHYHELHYSYWGLKHLVRRFHIHDFTKAVICDPPKYHVDYMLKPGSAKSAIARWISTRLPWLSPGYIWLLEKPDHENPPIGHRGAPQRRR
jgi:2-polyprenyl-3-methyl-5-hydroxy-6-metoxy-1,4-benzoquinol methylase